MKYNLELPRARTELSSSFAIDRRICPVIRPVDFLGLSHREYWLDCKCHSRFAGSDCLVFAVMRYPWWRVEFCIDTMATPVRDHTAAFGFRMLLNDFAKLPEWCAGLHKIDGQIQALSRRFNDFDRS